ncbi:hypothetical protein ACN42_g11950, partial [Penicillium freii]
MRGKLGISPEDQATYSSIDVYLCTYLLSASLNTFQTLTPSSQSPSFTISTLPSSLNVLTLLAPETPHPNSPSPATNLPNEPTNPSLTT